MTSQQQAEAARGRAGSSLRDVQPHSPAVDSAPVVVPRWALSPGKRLFDVLTSLLVLPVVTLMVAGAGLISMFAFRTWPLFFQQRRGLHGRSFRALKIRSLPRSFPDQQGKLGLDVSGIGRWSTMLRHSHVDELPQVFNILTGSMSMVGPRPMIDEVLQFLEPDDQRVRTLVRPGLTGAWQVSTAGALPLHDHPELDDLYVRRCGFRADLRLLGWTVLVVGRRRSFSPADVIAELSDQ